MIHPICLLWSNMISLVPLSRNCVHKKFIKKHIERRHVAKQIKWNIYYLLWFIHKPCFFTFGGSFSAHSPLYASPNAGQRTLLMLHISSQRGLHKTNNFSYRWYPPKGPYLPCVSMAGRALLAGYHRYGDEISLGSTLGMEEWWKRRSSDKSEVLLCYFQ